MQLKTIIFCALLIFIPLSVVAHALAWSESVVFIMAALAIVPLAGWIGEATEEIALVTGPSLGGLLNATFGNATELIIALYALNAGLVDVVKATITGSIISNLLLVMGLSMFLGGLKYKEQRFQPVVARMNASAMNLAVIAMLLPTTVGLTSVKVDEPILQTLSNAVAVVLIVVYFLSLLFSMKTHTYLYDVGVADMAPDSPQSSSAESAPAPEQGAESAPCDQPNLRVWVMVLLGATVIVALESELLVGSLEVATQQLGFSELFTGVILLPIFGNAAEHASAITVAMKNKMDLSVSVAVGSSLQVALFVAPVLVLAGWFLHQPMDLSFSPLELVAVAVAVLITNSISGDGLSNWLEGALLIAAYAVLGLAFYFYPAG